MINVWFAYTFIAVAATAAAQLHSSGPGLKVASANVAGSVSDKMRQLKEQSAKNVVLQLNNAKFREYIKWPGRNYSFVVLFAAMAAHRMCNICGVVGDEFELTAKSFRLLQQHGGGGGGGGSGGPDISDQLFFGFIDFDGNGETFQAMNVNSVPLIVFFAAAAAPAPARRHNLKVASPPLKWDALDMQRYGYAAESIARWLLEKSGHDIRVVRPATFFGTGGLIVLFFVGSIVIYFRCENVGVFSNRTIWAIAAVGFCLLMTSGQMWNHIRGPPFVTRAPAGHLNYVHASSHSQLIGETYAIFLLNAGITVSVIALLDNYPTSSSCSSSASTSSRNGSSSSSSSAKNRILPLICTLLAACFFNALLAIFRMKASNYPYRGVF